MKKFKQLYAVLSAIVFTAAMAFPAFAGTTQISKIDLTLEAEVYAEEDDAYVSADTSTSGCYIDDDDAVFTNEPSDGYWDEGDTPKVKVIVRADDDYQFASGFAKSNVKYSGPGEVTSVTRSKTKLTIKITLPEVDYSDDFYSDSDELGISTAKWDKEDGEGYWSKNSYADRYEVKLYRDDKVIMETKKTTSRRYDFSDYFTKKGIYMYKVRAVDEDDNRGVWKSSAEWSVSSSTAKKIGGDNTSTSTSGSPANSSSGGPGAASSPQGAWLKDSVGWWWCNADKTYPVSAWKQINNKWYYFNASGYCVQSSWVQTNNKWYYCDTDGDMAVSCWKQIKGLWYYLNASGECVMNSWVQTNGKYYYCGPNGDMWTNRRTPDGYWVNANGVWVR